MEIPDNPTKWTDSVSLAIRHSFSATAVVMDSCVPPGFRFHPTDEELVGYYLRKKVESQKIDLDVITDIDLYRIEPWDLKERCRIGCEVQNKWYFFSHRDKKYPTGTRTNRATMAGFWKATGRDKAVYDKSKLIGMRKTLVFYKGRAPNGRKSDWIMHEYRLESHDHGPPQEEGWVVCRAFKKKTTGQTKNFLHQNLLCRKEKEIDRLSFVDHSDVQFVQLSLMKRPSSVSLISDNTKHEEEEDEVQNRIICNNNKKVTDWRALDKFVASQLSQEDIFDDGGGVSSFEVIDNISNDDNSDMALMLLQNGSRGEGNKLDEFLNSSSDFDIGICLFAK
ncbi:Arabidopsis NAC domain containing protein 37, vascular related NAC-domain protein 1 [Hibiscus trionum]|uniref:Arabidopsis NAC domain containing protein 37, vascular related NAC-domain protein 1 n=1 Tax=Hibiscus trionum TaxID=183268 RepID=A0A9W7IZR2_HIBTR|nr:Arabidopsis NAC domain containing protein 37, vascular related NAC-domain protein 1 [Hibiscus trionum]